MQKLSPQQRANLRTCASCEWIFSGHGSCPKCGFASYGARFVYGDKAYRYKLTQEPWLKKKLDAMKFNLLCEIEETNEFKIKGTSVFLELYFKGRE